MLVLRVAAVLADQGETVEEGFQLFELLLVQVLDLFEPLAGDGLRVCVALPVIVLEVFET